MKKRLLTALVLLTEMFLFSASIVWAQPAPVAKTGQTKCFDTAGTEISCEGTGQDGEYQKGVPWPNPRFRDWGDGTVTDNLTGLMWEKDPNLTDKSFGGALGYASILSLGTSCGGTYTDWRLPNVKELQSLIDYGNYGPALPKDNPFLNAQSSLYWSSTNIITAFPAKLIVSTGDGQTGQDTTSEHHGGQWYGAWAVRGETAGSPAPIGKTGLTYVWAYGDDADLQKGVASPTPRFLDLGDGTVKDKLTGLIWTKDANHGTMSWDDALNYANNLSLGTSCGGTNTDWRLPNVKELQSLIDSLNYMSDPFINLQEDVNYWSSTSDMSSAGRAWVRFYGLYSSKGKGAGYYVWPVRSGN